MDRNHSRPQIRKARTPREKRHRFPWIHPLSQSRPPPARRSMRLERCITRLGWMGGSFPPASSSRKAFLIAKPRFHLSNSVERRLFQTDTHNTNQAASIFYFPVGSKLAIAPRYVNPATIARSAVSSKLPLFKWHAGVAKDNKARPTKAIHLCKGTLILKDDQLIAPKRQVVACDKRSIFARRASLSK
jgi:hypothetical protein